MFCCLFSLHCAGGCCGKYSEYWALKRFHCLVLSGGVLNVQKLPSLLNMSARNPLVLQIQKKTGHPPLLTEFLFLLAVQNVPFLHNYCVYT